ncbi:MAG: hypothetical protein ABI886_04730 [Betaproteobacteria bacterium]
MGALSRRRRLEHVDLVGAGMNELAAGELDASAALLDEAAARFPKMPAVMLCHACVCAERDDAARAHPIERDCLARFPAHSPASRAVLMALLRDRDATLQLLAAALAEHAWNCSLSRCIRRSIGWRRMTNSLDCEANVPFGNAESIPANLRAELRDEQ